MKIIIIKLVKIFTDFFQEPLSSSHCSFIGFLERRDEDVRDFKNQPIGRESIT